MITVSHQLFAEWARGFSFDSQGGILKTWFLYFSWWIAQCSFPGSLFIIHVLAFIIFSLERPLLISVSDSLSSYCLFWHFGYSLTIIHHNFQSSFHLITLYFLIYCIWLNILQGQIPCLSYSLKNSRLSA